MKNEFIMIKNYIKIAFRFLINQKFYSILNIAGLSVGLSCFLLIALYVNDELSYDRFHKDAENIYRMEFEGELGGNVFVTALSSAPTAKTLKEEFPEVIDATRMRSTSSWLLRKSNDVNSFIFEKVSWADHNIFSFFGIPLVYGDPENALKKPNQLAITKTMAKTIFGNINPVGEFVQLDNEKTYEISAVYEDLPSNSHFHYDMLLSMETLEESKSSVWLSINFSTYIRLSNGIDYKEVENKLPDLTQRKIGDELKKALNLDDIDLTSPDSPARFTLIPLQDIHLKSDKLGEHEANGDIKYIYIFSAVAIFILLLACINFMNLATARSTKRAKEVGVRKVMGAYKRHLVNQFLTEAMVISLISTILAAFISLLLLPFFNELTYKQFHDTDIFSPKIVGLLIAITIVVGFLAGSYPSFYLSQFKPVETLKGKLNLGMKSAGIRSTLVVVQFTISISMIIGTAIVFDQLSYIQNKKLGFNKDHVIMVKDAWLLDDKVNVFKQEVLKDSRVINGTVATFLPVRTTNNNNMFLKGSNPQSDEKYILGNYNIDYDYIPTLGIEIKEGRNFSKEFGADSTGILLNESAVSMMDLENPIGSVISSYNGGMENPSVNSYKVIGVVKDFHFSSLRDNIGPILFQLGNSNGFVSFKIKGDDVSGTIASIRETWNKVGPGQPFDFDFLDQRFSDLYKSEQQIGSIFSVFAFLAIFIACLGLYGLAAFTTEQKTKEIGIRKVLGASVSSIITLLSKEFVKLVTISFGIAVLVSTFFMNKWLEDFVYRTNLKPITFVLAGLISLSIAWITMAIQSYKAATGNPAKTLKSE